MHHYSHFKTDHRLVGATSKDSKTLNKTFNTESDKKALTPSVFLPLLFDRFL